jgi:threonine dehydratase
VGPRRLTAVVLGGWRAGWLRFERSATVGRMTAWEMPTFADGLDARRRISAYLRATPLAAALRLQAELASKRVALIATGGNATRAQILEVLSEERKRDAAAAERPSL